MPDPGSAPHSCPQTALPASKRPTAAWPRCARAGQGLAQAAFPPILPVFTHLLFSRGSLVILLEVRCLTWCSRHVGECFSHGKPLNILQSPVLQVGLTTPGVSTQASRRSCGQMCRPVPSALGLLAVLQMLELARLGMWMGWAGGFHTRLGAGVPAPLPQAGLRAWAVTFSGSFWAPPAPLSVGRLAVLGRLLPWAITWAGRVPGSPPAGIPILLALGAGPSRLTQPPWRPGLAERAGCARGDMAAKSGRQLGGCRWRPRPPGRSRLTKYLGLGDSLSSLPAAAGPWSSSVWAAVSLSR